MSRRKSTVVALDVAVERLEMEQVERFALGTECADPLLDGANPEQAQAIQHVGGPLGVFAGAGSGKTRVIVHRVGWLVKHGVPANRILAVTFSKNAADEMKARAKKLGLDAEFRTWHSLALHILKEDHTPWANWKVDDTDRAKFVLKEVLGYKGMRWDKVDVGQVSSFIGYCSSQEWEPEGEQAMAFALRKFGNGSDAGLANEAFGRYRAALAEARLLTFDDFLTFAVKWLRQPGVAERWASKWDYILQDEAQDANPMQLHIARMLAQGHQNYCVVGDPAQSIYKFRGSDPTFLLRFKDEWGGATVINMHRNYRCGRKIIDAANGVIRPSTNRLPVDIIAEGGWDGVVTWRQPDSLEEEGEEVAGSIKEHVACGSKLSEQAVLYRLNAQSRGIEEALLKEAIPYVVVGGVSFYERKEVKDLLAYLRLVDGRAVEDSIKRALNAPFRYLGNAYLEKVLACLGGNCVGVESAVKAVMRACDAANVQSRQRGSAREFCGVLERSAVVAANGAKPSGILTGILEATQYEAWLKRDSGEESVESSHVANVKELVRVAERFESVKALLDFVDGVIQDARRNEEGNKGKDRVVLMSIHKSKGLEFRHVHLVGCCEMIMPHPRSEDPDEERRLMYVACTRAKESLLVTSPRHIATRSGLMEVEPSRFLRDAGLV